MSTSWPLLRNWPQISASRSHAMTLWYSVRSPPPPRNSLVATTNVASGFPLGSVRSSGSRVSRPTSMTLFIPIPPARFTGCSAPGRVGRSGCRLSEKAYRALSHRLPAVPATNWLLRLAPAPAKPDLARATRARPAAWIEVVDAGRAEADLGDRRRLALVLHPGDPRGDPFDEIAIQAGGHAAVDRPSAVDEGEQGAIQFFVRASQLAFIGLARPQVGRWRLGDDLGRDAEVLGERAQLRFVQVADGHQPGCHVPVLRPVTEQCLG